jgi:hypothetical protein
MAFIKRNYNWVRHKWRLAFLKTNPHEGWVPLERLNKEIAKRKKAEAELEKCNGKVR